MNIDDGGPAFPVLDLSKTQVPGMSLRDYFAAKALSGWLAAFSHPDIDPTKGVQKQPLADFTYAVADAMLEARKGTSKPK